MSDVELIELPVTRGESSLRSWPAWRDLLLRAAVGLLTIFTGVTAAFFFDGYRDQLEQAEQLNQARAGGKLLPQFQVHMELLGRFSADLRRLNLEATRLRMKLEAQVRNQGGDTSRMDAP